MWHFCENNNENNNGNDGKIKFDLKKENKIEIDGFLNNFEGKHMV